MDALILAAGRGTRLGALGESTPKALIDIAGQTMLERVASALVNAGVTRLIINVCHHADRIEEFVNTHDLGAEVILSHEAPDPLETGGGLLHARSLFRRHHPFFIHNVDVLADIDFPAMQRTHATTQALATLAVHERASSRQLLFDAKGLYGRLDLRRSEATEVRQPTGGTRSLAFAGIHVASPELLDRLSERGVFSIFEPYLRLAGNGESILPFPIDHVQWLEIGTPDRLEAARRILSTSQFRNRN